ncbi:MAG: glycosyltransferase family 4 protein [Actinomycetota bacterium]|nr:glycosyltransferase family 4 protein [Actinomycetota bacterium]
MQHPHTRPPITYVATHFPAVSHTFIADEIDALEHLGVEVRVVSINTVSDADRQADTRGRHRHTTYLKATARWRVVVAVAATMLRHPSVLAIPLRSGPPGLRPRLWRCFHLAEGILVFRAMRRSGSTHVHAHFGQTPASIAWYAVEVAHRHRHCAEYRWSATIHGWHEFVDESEAQLRQKVASASFVACISDFTRAQLMRISEPADWPKLHVVRCGIDVTRFTLREHEPAQSPPRIALVARVSAEKGHAVLIDAVALLRERGITVAVDAVGPEPDGHGALLRQRAEAAGIAEAITWHGPQPPTRVAELLGAADVFCLPTFAEGLPVVIMEAMARGLPVVTTYISGIPELAIDGDTALVVPAARADLLADALARLLADATLRARLVAAAAAAVATRHDIRSNATALAALFDEAAEVAST